MPHNYTRTVNWTGANSGAGPNYTWEEVSNSSSGWVSYAESSTTDAWIFQISDNTASNAVTRAATFRVKHHTYTDGSDANTFDEFTITQYASGTVEVTSATAATTTPTNATNATDAPTNATNATDAPTNATNATDAPTNATNATDAPTNATNATDAPTNATAATTNATAATTIFSDINWDNATLTDSGLGFSSIQTVTKEAGSGNGVGTMPNYDASGGSGNLGQAGAIYWANAVGSVVEVEPSWILGVDANDPWGTGSGITQDNQLRVVITLDSWPDGSGGGSSSGSGSGGDSGSGSGEEFIESPEGNVG